MCFSSLDNLDDVAFGALKLSWPRLFRGSFQMSFVVFMDMNMVDGERSLT